MDTSYVTEKGQATIPAAIRKKLGLKKGDKVAFTVEKNGKIVLKKAERMDRMYLTAIEKTLAEEWLSPEDCAAYDHL